TPLPHRTLPSFPTRRSSDLAQCQLTCGSSRPLMNSSPTYRRVGSAAQACTSGSVKLFGSSARLASTAEVPVHESSGRSAGTLIRSEEHTSELQSLRQLVCRL